MNIRVTARRWMAKLRLAFEKDNELHFAQLVRSAVDAAQSRGVRQAALPGSRRERDFCRRRQRRRKHRRDRNSSAETEKWLDEIARRGANVAFVRINETAWVSEDWVVGAPGLEPGTR